MITVRNKQTGRVFAVEPHFMEVMKGKGDPFATLYEIISAPPTPKEIKKLSGKQKPESENDGIEILNDRLLGEDPGEI